MTHVVIYLLYKFSIEYVLDETAFGVAIDDYDRGMGEQRLIEFSCTNTVQ